VACGHHLSIAHHDLAPDSIVFCSEVVLELCPFLRQNIRFWNKIKIFSRELVLHATYIDCKTVLASEFHARREVINLLEGRQTLVKIAFTLGVRP
jgi:hypothetical protein